MKLIAFIVPMPLGMFSRGTHNGYVAIPPEHTCYKKDYLEPPVDGLKIHGGITFSEPVTNGKTTFMSDRAYKSEYIGKRNYLLDEAEYITEEKDIPNDWWILGFDTNHYMDNPRNWDRERVIEETLRLKEQLERMTTDNPN